MFVSKNPGSSFECNSKLFMFLCFTLFINFVFISSVYFYVYVLSHVCIFVCLFLFPKRETKKEHWNRCLYSFYENHFENKRNWPWKLICVSKPILDRLLNKKSKRLILFYIVDLFSPRVLFFFFRFLLPILFSISFQEQITKENETFHYVEINKQSNKSLLLVCGQTDSGKGGQCGGGGR